MMIHLGTINPVASTWYGIQDYADGTWTHTWCGLWAIDPDKCHGYLDEQVYQLPPSPAAPRPPAGALNPSTNTTIGGETNPNAVNEVISGNRTEIEADNLRFFEQQYGRDVAACALRAQKDSPIGFGILGAKMYCDTAGNSTGFDLSPYALAAGGLAAGLVLLLVLRK